MACFNWFLVHFVTGFWLVMSPYILNFTDRPGAYWNAIIVGLFFIATSGLGLYHNGPDSDELVLPKL